MSKTHHESHTRLHNIWCDMNKRCKYHKQYAGRGIKMCGEWHDYEKFAEWARSNGYADDLTIERIDVNKDYCPENCKWIPLGSQARNRTTTKWVMFMGRKMSLAEAAEIAGLPYKQVHYRIKNGWSVEDALSIPLKHGKSDLHILCDNLGLDYKGVYQRVYTYGWTVEEAISKPFLGRGANGSHYGHPMKREH